MRWKAKIPAKRGDERIITTFLWFIKTIGTDKRWLEYAKIKQKFEGYEGYEGYELIWRDVEFVPHDPVYDCNLCKDKGCAHIDGYLCNIETCEESLKYNK